MKFQDNWTIIRILGLNGLKEDVVPTELMSGSFNGTGLYYNIPAGFQLQTYNGYQKLMFRKDYISGQNSGPVVIGALDLPVFLSTGLS